MKSGISFEQGEIVLIPFPFTDLTTSKQRPVLVLSKTQYNKKFKDFISCGITSNIKDVECSVLIDQEDLISGFLPVPSMIKVDKIFTLEKSLAIKSIGKIKPEIWKKVRDELFKLFE
jgi:mRNA interferase MazF